MVTESFNSGTPNAMLRYVQPDPAWGDVMLESGYWWQHALQDALDEQDSVERKTKLVRLVILGRLVSSSEIDRKEEDALFDTLDALRALDWERLSTPAHLESIGSSLARQ